LAERGAELGRAFVGSLTMGAGQFCTNPGLLLAVPGPGLDAFVAAAAAAMGDAAAGVMLHAGILAAYRKGIARLAETPGIERLGTGPTAEGRAGAALFATDAETFERTPHLAEEVFGAAGLLVRHAGWEALAPLLHGLEGQLTITLHMTAADEPLAARLLPVLERKAGRILVNGWPTGVEVSHAMVHGGPFPATSDSRTTSVGTLAIRRFLRPVCYQNLAPALLPEALSDANPWRLWRRLDGELTPPG
jgi:NADP-dependent aldehyde dehydrogenase